MFSLIIRRLVSVRPLTCWLRSLKDGELIYVFIVCTEEGLWSVGSNKMCVNAFSCFYMHLNQSSSQHYIIGYYNGSMYIKIYITNVNRCIFKAQNLLKGKLSILHIKVCLQVLGRTTVLVKQLASSDVTSESEYFIDPFWEIVQLQLLTVKCKTYCK